MKKITPWICFMIAASSAVAQNQEGLDAYRQGYYLQASQNLTKDMPDPVVDYYLGRMNLYGYGELKNNLQAIRYFKRAADRGHLFAARFMGRYALNIEQDPAQALVWFKKAADANDLPSQMYCVAAYRNGFGTAKNLDLAQRYTIAAAKNGHALAQYALAESFLNSKDYFFCINYYFLSYLIALFILCYLFNYLYFTAKKLYFHLYLSFPI
jgi:enhanced entry protein EnhC